MKKIITHDVEFSKPAGVKAAVGLEAGQDAAIRVLNNPAGSGAPTVNDDSGDGYSFGSLWVDTSDTPSEIYKCVDATAGAAEWVNTSLTLDDLGSMAVEDTTSYYTRTQIDTVADELAIENQEALDEKADLFALNDVADNLAKRVLTGIDPGYPVQITGEGNRIEKYLGDVASDTAEKAIILDGFVVSGDALAQPINSIYIFRPEVGFSYGRPIHDYVVDSSTKWRIRWDDAKWIIADQFYSGANVFESTEDVATPDLVTTWTPVGDGVSAGTVEPHGPGADNNWLVLEDTMEILIRDDGMGLSSHTVNGVSLVEGSTVGCGWVKRNGYIPVTGDYSSIGSMLLKTANGAGTEENGSNFKLVYLFSTGAVFPVLPFSIPPRSQIELWLSF